MQPKKLFKVVILLLLCVIGLKVTLAQGGTETPPPIPTIAVTPTQGPVEDVAILIVDVFAEGIPSEPIPFDSLSGECAVSIVGQDGAAFRGNAISSALFPLVQPHGNLVFQHMKNVLSSNQYGGTLIDTLTLPNAPPAELWQTSRGNVWLAGVDTQGYMLDVIADQVDVTINELQAVHGINRFVINMSFGLVPCDLFPELSAENYIDQLNKWGIQAPYDNTTSVGQMAIALSSLVTSPPADELAALIDVRNDPVFTQTFGLLHLALMQTKIKLALTPPTNPNNPGEEPKDFSDFVRRHPNLTIVQVASAGNDGYDYPYYPANARNVLSVSAAYSPYNCSLGNHNNVYNYLNTTYGFTGFAVDQIIHHVLSPLSNYGEVIENGISTLEPSYYLPNYAPGSGADVLGCLTGTSFSAPRVSIEMAFDLVSGNGKACFNSVGAKLSEPPLAHAKWDNLEIPAAAALYCPGFPRN
jgi:hypothetical protein